MTYEGNESVEQEFKLFAVSSHHGLTVSYGHFTATVLNDDENVWYHYNDERLLENYQ